MRPPKCRQCGAPPPALQRFACALCGYPTPEADANAGTVRRLDLEARGKLAPAVLKRWRQHRRARHLALCMRQQARRRARHVLWDSRPPLRALTEHDRSVLMTPAVLETLLGMFKRPAGPLALKSNPTPGPWPRGALMIAAIARRPRR